jgi:hypothetical protein
MLCDGRCPVPLLSSETESYMDKLTFTMAFLSDVRVIMVIMCVPLVELLYQAVMG